MYRILAALILCCTAFADRPNVVLIMTDDQGYGDLSCHGNTDLQTPQLDALYAESVRLTNFHVDPTCAPTRAALLTGRYALRAGVWHTIAGRSLLPRDELTVAQVFQQAGYRTGMFGKWHLGDNAGYRPNDRGFDECIHHGGGGVGQTPDAWGNDYFDDRYWHNGALESYQGYCTDVFFRGALDFIERNRARPFFCYLAPNAPHGPYYVPEAAMKPYLDRGIPESRARFYGMVANIDMNVGRMRRQLKDWGLADNTIFIFMTDNGTAGPWFPKEGEDFSAGLRGIKGSIYEGGHRVPFFVHWPKGGLKGGVDRNQLAAHFDLFPTLLDLCDIPIKEALPPQDGISLAPVLSGQLAGWKDRILVVNNQRIAVPVKWRNATVMNQRWRLVDKNELYDMTQDRGQATDVAKEHPDVVIRLRTAYEQWWASASTRAGTIASIVVGAKAGESEILTAHDWDAAKVPWDQTVIKEAPLLRGAWAIEVAEAGEYEIVLRQQPAEAAFAIEGTRARLKLGEQVFARPIRPGDTAVRFSVTLREKGRTRLEGWFELAEGKTRGAYYAELTRKSSVRAELKMPQSGFRQVRQLGDFPLVVDGRIWNMVFSADGNALITVSDRVIRQHLDHSKKQHVLWRPKENESMSHAVFSKDRKFFARIENGMNIHIHDAVNGELLRTLADRGACTLAGDWGPQGKLFAAGGKGEIVLWNVETGELVKRIPHQGSAVVTLGISPDGKRIAAGNEDENGVQGLLYIHAIHGESTPLRLEEGTGWSSRLPLVFSPDGKTVSGPSELNGGSKFCIWDVQTGKALHRFPGGFNFGVYAPDGTWVAAGGLNNIQAWDVETGEEVFRHQGESINEHVWSLAISPDGNLLAAGIENRVRYWNTRTWGVSNPSESHHTPVRSVAFSTDGNHLVSGSRNGRVILWDWKTKRPVWVNNQLSHRSFREVDEDTEPYQNYSWGVRELSLSRDGSLIVVNAHSGRWKDRRFSEMKTYHVISRQTGKITRSMDCGGHAWGNVLITKDKPTAYTGSGEGPIYAWDLKTGRKTREIGTQPAGPGGKGITFLAFDGDSEERIWWSGEHHRLGMRRLRDGKDVRILTGGSETHDSRIQVSPNHDWVMAGKTLWRLPEGALVEPRGNASFHKNGLPHPSGLISLGVSGGKAVLMDMLTFRPMHEIDFGPGEILSVTFSPDGKSLVAAGEFGIKYLDFPQWAQRQGLERAGPEKLWTFMGEEDPWFAYQAAWALSHKADWMAFVAQTIPPAVEPSQAEISRLKATMQDGNGDVAAAAARLLLDMGVALSEDEIASLRRPDNRPYSRAFTGRNSIPGIDYQVPLGPVPELLPLSQRRRSARAVMLLEADGSDQAIAMLGAFAGGDAKNPLTKQAACALSRLKIK